jgi:hypothetical protein
MSRCIDDHPQTICLCESEIHRALLYDFYVELHFQRMRFHGLSAPDIVHLLDRKRQCDLTSLFNWYHQVTPKVTEVLQKKDIQCLGDKSPDFYESPELVDILIRDHKLIYTVRDPRAILMSILRQKDSSAAQKQDRWNRFEQNFRTWEPHLDRENLLVVRLEDLIAAPETTMTGVYEHLNLPYSSRFTEKFERLFPGRFLWKQVVNTQSGIHNAFDPHKIDQWKNEITQEQLDLVNLNPSIVRFMNRFGYE